MINSSVFLLSLTFCCLHSIHCTCYVPCDDHQSTYFLYLPLNTYLLFSWSHPVHWPLSLPARLAHLCIWISTLTFHELLLQSCDLSQWPVPLQFSAFTICAAEHFASYLSLEVSLPWHDPAAFYTDVQRTTNWYFHSYSFPEVSFLSVEPAVYHFVVQRTQFFFLIFFALNQRPLPPKPSTLSSVLARLRWWCEE